MLEFLTFTSLSLIMNPQVSCREKPLAKIDCFLLRQSFKKC